ncbi:MAG: methionine--tRNA ligase [Magnetococcales bacterium]|nr:methionine--tRNA ligase [Magnetococcales bacterium]
MRRILVTSALPYANGQIHLGHLVETIQTDIWVRFQKLQGHECRYFCADDTHGTPVMIRARQEGITPEALVERIHAEHLSDFDGFHIEFDNYYTTNSQENRLLSEEVYLNNRQAGNIRVSQVRQAYCERDGMFLPDRFIRGRCPACGAEDQYGDACEVCSGSHAPLDLKEPRCALCGDAPVERESEHFFFRLTAFEPFLKSWIRSGALQPEMANKLDEWFEAGLQDWDISRDGPYFGFEIPDAPGKYFYVWLDAPIGYMASTWAWCKREGRDFDAIWRRDDQMEVYHFIGKDILYFHTLFWPATLHGAGFRVPNAVYVHGFLTVNGQKMSKSRGTFITARQYLEVLDPEYLRYYYAAKLTARVDDLDLNLDDFILRVNSDLVGKVVNIASRSAGFIQKRFEGLLCERYPDDGGLRDRFVAAGDEIATLYAGREYAKAMRAIMQLADEANRYVEARAPWTLAKDPDQSDALHATCTVALELFRILMIYLQPVLPKLAERCRDFLRLPPFTWEARLHPLQAHRIGAFSHLMERVDPKKVEQLIQSVAPPVESIAQANAKTATKAKKAPPCAVDTESKATASAPAASAPNPAPTHVPAPSPAVTAETIDIETFGKIDLRVARILTASLVEGADKLLCLTLDVGELGEKTVFAGIRQACPPDTLPGRLTVLVANLQPRKMRFGTSEGMVLAAGPGGKELYLLSPDSGATPGMRIR